MIDTPRKVADIYKKMIMSRTPAERLRMASAMFEAARVLAIAGIKAEGMNLSDLELRRRIFIRFYSKDFSSEEMTKILHLVTGPDPLQPQHEHLTDLIHQARGIAQDCEQQN